MNSTINLIPIRRADKRQRANTIGQNDKYKRAKKNQENCGPLPAMGNFDVITSNEPTGIPELFQDDMVTVPSLVSIYSLKSKKI